MVSVIVPIYKVEAYLDKCIESILGQTYRDLEIILVDDGSPDRCPAICDAWAEKDSRIKVIHKSNGGLSDARNAGLAAATGELVSFIDSDDWVAPEFIQTLYDAMIRTGAEIAECGTAFVDEEGRVLRLRQAEKELILEPVEALQRAGSIIGTGYHIRRLDGLVARFLRMSALQKYEQLACLTRQQFAFDCLWHLQCVLRHLEGEEQQQAKQDILAMLGCTARVPQRKLRLNLKYRIWYELLQSMPETTAKIRNKLKVGS